MKRWKCTVCGYIHTGAEPPEKCPVCGADRSKFIELVETAPADEPVEPAVAATGQAASEPRPEEAARQWRCSVCGYGHTGAKPPEKCPVCGTSGSKFTEVVEEATAPAEEAPKAAAEALDPEPAASAPSSGNGRSDYWKLYERLTQEMTRFHAHPISVHIPNGLFPVSVVFILLSILFSSHDLATAAFCNLVFVVLGMPLVLFTGYNDWKRRYGGNLTDIFRTKMICGGIVTAVSLALTLWWIVQPAIISSGGGGRWLFMALSLVGLAAAGVAGYFGGKLVFFYGGEK